MLGCTALCIMVSSDPITFIMMLIFSSPEPKAQDELLPSDNVRRATCVVRGVSSTIASNDISFESSRPRALIFG